MGGIAPVQQDTLTVQQAMELLRRRRLERGAVRTETEPGRPPIGDVPQLTQEQARSIFRRRRLRAMGFEAEGEDLIPPIAETIFARPPQPPEEIPVGEPLVAQPPRAPLEPPQPSEAAERLRSLGGPALPEPVQPPVPPTAEEQAFAGREAERQRQQNALESAETLR